MTGLLAMTGPGAVTPPRPGAAGVASPGCWVPASPCSWSVGPPRQRFSSGTITAAPPRTLGVQRSLRRSSRPLARPPPRLRRLPCSSRPPITFLPCSRRASRTTVPS